MLCFRPRVLHQLQYAITSSLPAGSTSAYLLSTALGIASPVRVVHEVEVVPHHRLQKRVVHAVSREPEAVLSSFQ